LSPAIPDQSIYLGRVKPKQLKRLLGRPLVHPLRDIERLTQHNFQLANTVYPEAPIRPGTLVKEGPKARHDLGTSRRDEFMKVFREAERTSQVELPSAILFPTHALIHAFASTVSIEMGWGEPPPMVKRGPITDYQDFNRHFARHRSTIRFLAATTAPAESDSIRLVYLMTYHSAKGLDFTNVFLPHLTAATQLDAKPGHLSDWDRERGIFRRHYPQQESNCTFRITASRISSSTLSK